MPSNVANIKLASAGKLSFEWAASLMPILEKIMSKNQQSQPLAGFRLGLCLHITKETSVLALAAQNLGAQVAICSANPLSVQDDIAAFMASEGISTFAWRRETHAEYIQCIKQVLNTRPHIVTDDGADLHTAAHNLRVRGICGGTEETTSGVKRLRALQTHKKLMYPVIAVNNASTKYLFDNRHGTGQSTIDGILRASSVFLPGKKIVVCGYGWVGKGVATRARGMGAVVIVTEVDPVRALEAHMDGFEVMKLLDAADHGDIFVTCTGQTDVIRKEHFEKMKNGAMLANAGHFDVEIDTRSLRFEAEGAPVEVRSSVERFILKGKKRIYLLSKGRVVNLVAAEGHPPEVMALSFANQLLSIIYIAKNHTKMSEELYDVPLKIDMQVARYALDAMNIKIDQPTPQQKEYLKSN